jgi:hypothetical protein
MSYTNNPTSIIAGTGISITPTSGTGANLITIDAVGTPLMAVTVATATPVTVVDADDVISVEVTPAVAVAVNLPAGVTGQVFNIKDGLGLAAVATPITITPAAGTIDGAANAVINVPYGSLQIVYSGTEWKII